MSTSEEAFSMSGPILDQGREGEKKGGVCIRDLQACRRPMEPEGLKIPAVGNLISIFGGRIGKTENQ